MNELAAAVHENAVAHGWWEQERELPEILMLCVSELAEALEEYRAGKPNIYYNVEGEEILYADGEACEKYERRKPEGVAVELADCVIRILDYCGRAGIDIEELYGSSTNTTKPAHIATAGRNVDRGSGALVSPFANDPFALVALAFKNLYHEREYAAYFVPEVEDGSGGEACGVTTFPEDGSPPVVEVSGEIPIAAGVEIFAHELAHVATPEDREHGEAWKAAFDRIFEEYNRIAQDLFGKGGEEPC